MKSARDPRYLEVVARLRAARQGRGLSQAEVAKRLGKPQSYISKIETCERRLDLAETIAICEVLGVGLNTVVPSEVTHLLHAE